MTRIWLSNYAINMYEDCPGKWKNNYILKMKGKEDEGFKRGREVHDCIEQFYPDIKHSVMLSEDLTRLPAYFQTILLQCAGPVDETQERCLANFAEFEAYRWEILASKYGKTKETLKYFFPVLDFTEKFMRDKRLGYKYIPDALFLSPDGDYIVVDYKSNPTAPKELGDKPRRQVVSYIYCLNEIPKLRGKVKHGAVLYLAGPVRFVVKPTNVAFDGFLDRLGRTRSAIEAEKFDYKWGTWPCSHTLWGERRYCEYYDHCHQKFTKGEENKVGEFNNDEW